MKHFIYLIMSLLILAGCIQEEKESPILWATFNIRYDNARDHLNDWQHRKERVCHFILDKKLDIIGMQEVLHHQFQDLHQGLPGYKGIGVGRDDGQTGGEYAPLFYRADKYEAIDANTFWLSEYPDSIGYIGWDAACTRIATWAKFREKATGKIFMAINTHFDHVGVEARKQSALLIIKKIKEIVKEQPAVITGDFNINDQSEAYKTITTNEFVLKDAHKTAKQISGASYTYHDFTRLHPKKREKIDFIFTTSQIEVLQSEIQAEDPEALLSDHNPQIVSLIF